LLIGWYYAAVDFDWLRDHLLSANPRMEQMPAEQRERAMSMMVKPFLVGSGIVGAAVGVATMLVLEAAYFLVAGKITNVQHSFDRWLSLACWAAVPGLIGIAASAMLLLSSGTNFQIGPADLQVFSINNLLAHRKQGDAGYTLLTTLNFMSMWSWAVAIIGVRVYSSRSWLYSSTVVLLPYALIYGVWAYLAFGG
jgi:hypothetical protein